MPRNPPPLTQGLKAALADAAVEEGWPAGRLPTSAQLREADRPELARVRGWGPLAAGALAAAAQKMEGQHAP
jgi:hypothetical protein